MYMSGMHGGHAGGKTSAFKRCVFLKFSQRGRFNDILVNAMHNRPTPLCYFRLLHGGQAISDVAEHSTAFGCRDWDYACVVTGVWPREEDGSHVARAAVNWAYDVAKELLPLSSGTYGADLGPDPRDAVLATRAFGQNLSRLARLKNKMDQFSVLPYACPLPEAQKLIVLVSGHTCAGKDFCADAWASVFTQGGIRARVVSISATTKREYAASTGADLVRLLHDRAYKEQHRAALTEYWQTQQQKAPLLPEEHFMGVVRDAEPFDVLLVTGVRDEAPLAAFSHLVPKSRVVEVRVKADVSMRLTRGAGPGVEDEGGDSVEDYHYNNCPSFVFNNSSTGHDAAKAFAETHLLPYCHPDLGRLADMVRTVDDFPRAGIEFRNVLGISQQTGGMELCTSLLQSYFTSDWADVELIACCETGSFVFASALSMKVAVPLALIRDAGKLPPPTISVTKSSSHISSSTSDDRGAKKMEIGRGVIPTGARVVIVDDVLATGETLCAVLQLLAVAGVRQKDVQVMVIAEFTAHCGRALIRERGFGATKISSLLVFGGH